MVCNTQEKHRFRLIKIDFENTDNNFRPNQYHTGGLTRAQPQKKSAVVYEKAIQKKKFIKLELDIHEKCRQIYLRTHEDEPEPSKRIRRIMKEYLELESSEGEEEKSEGSESDAE
ncbi:hypothetical protein DdX_19417 [Ditylenchus destructor]|uniref:Uncharacterized protein n=1 Tax=Ditylenchus destructor TaxID=166010 RepID=A0AAD4MJ42_9BILA|nr:hypothetical protein DdX_19417 [Ditylenchus destructor]